MLSFSLDCMSATCSFEFLCTLINLLFDCQSVITLRVVVEEQ